MILRPPRSTPTDTLVPSTTLFRSLVSKGALVEGVFKGETINTPSMLAVEDAIFALEWAKSLGGLDGLKARSDTNAAALDRIVADREWHNHLPDEPASRSKTTELGRATRREIGSTAVRTTRVAVKIKK